MNTHVEESMSQKVQKTLRFILLCVLFVIFVFPFVLVIINVFKTKADINTAPLALIGSHGFSLDNFPAAMEKMNFWKVFTNSLIITISATVLTILFSCFTKDKREYNLPLVEAGPSLLYLGNVKNLLLLSIENTEQWKESVNTYSASLSSSTNSRGPTL